MLSIIRYVFESQAWERNFFKGLTDRSRLQPNMDEKVNKMKHYVTDNPLGSKYTQPLHWRSIKGLSKRSEEITPTGKAFNKILPKSSPLNRMTGSEYFERLNKGKYASTK